MIHYHGLPIRPATAAYQAIKAGHAFVPYRKPDQLVIALEHAQSFATDNGAFSAWREGEPVTDWSGYYEWIAELHRYPGFDFAVIPDVIDGDEAANDALLDEWPWRARAPWVGAPVWHLHESLERLVRLARVWPRICLGSSGQYARVGSPQWFARMVAAMAVLCDRDGRPVVKIHGLRMLDRRIFSLFPFASADSTNIGRNVGIDSKWKGPYSPATRETRAVVLRELIESVQGGLFWSPSVAGVQTELAIDLLSDMPGS